MSKNLQTLNTHRATPTIYNTATTNQQPPTATNRKLVTHPQTKTQQPTTKPTIKAPNTTY